MRRGAEAGMAAAMLALGLAAGAGAAAASGDPQEDLAATEAVLAAFDQPPTEQERQDLAAPWSAVDKGRLALLWQREAFADPVLRARVDIGGEGWLLRGRWRRPALSAGPGVTLAAGGDGLKAVAGGWTWRSGHGLLLGGAGRQGSLAADSTLLPAGGGPRGWAGGPTDGAAVGAAVATAGQGWTASAGAGRTEDGGRVVVGSVGRASGAWQVLAVRSGDGPPAFALSGRRRGPGLDAAWEAAWPGGAATRPSLAASVGIDVGGGIGVESGAWAIARGPRPAGAAALPLLGTAAGSAWAVRCRWRPSQAVTAALALGAGRREDRSEPAQERRSSSEALVRVRFAARAAAELRLRAAGGRKLTWSDDHPWAPPQAIPTRSTRTIGLSLRETGRVSRWRVAVRSLAVDHALTTGRRTLVAVELAGGAGGGSWRLGWRRLWGAPVDLVDAFAPLPGLVLPRHWGRWDGGWLASWRGERGGIEGALAAEIRQPAAGPAAVGLWAGVAAGW